MSTPMPSLLSFLAGFSLWLLLCLLAGIRASRRAVWARRERASAAAGPSRRPLFLPHPPRLVQRGGLFLLSHHKETP